ncbi:MAG: SDR family NAD(P)-dependent oxidoreductase [Thermodesulfobacteriota bacterium]
MLITGAGRGIGAALARHFAEAGAALALCARSADELATTTRTVTSLGAPTFSACCDVSDPVAARLFVADASSALGGIDVLINNAAIAGPIARLDDISPENWREVLEINLLGTVHMCQSTLPIFRRQGHGRIINMAGGGVGGKKFSPRKTAYITSKFAIYGLTETLAAELDERVITVNAISPGSVDSRLRDSLLETENQSETTAEQLSPAPACRLAAFLASDFSGRLTGRILSARWDLPRSWEQLAEYPVQNLYTLRRVDGINFLDAGQNSLSSRI